MDIGRRAAEMATPRLFLTGPRDSLGLFMPLGTGSQGFYHRPDRFRVRGGPQRAVLLPPGAPKPASGILNPPADSALHYRSFGGVTRGPARLTVGPVVLVVPRVLRRPQSVWRFSC